MPFVLKDELLKQLPDEPLAKKLSDQTFLFSDFVARAEFSWPQLNADVVVHGHCHQKSVFGMKGETVLLEKLGVRWTMLDTGCCGMAGSFGFSGGHYDLSMRIAEDKLLPLIRKVPATAFVVTNGFSCREQIHQGAGRSAIHVAQLALEALRTGHDNRLGTPLADADLAIVGESERAVTRTT
jgi:Fe-S oxidoreductase